MGIKINNEELIKKLANARKSQMIHKSFKMLGKALIKNKKAPQKKKEPARFMALAFCL